MSNADYLSFFLWNRGRGVPGVTTWLIMHAPDTHPWHHVPPPVQACALILILFHIVQLLSHNIIQYHIPLAAYSRVRLNAYYKAILTSDNGFSSVRRQATAWTNDNLYADSMRFGLKYKQFTYEKVELKKSFAKQWSFCAGLNLLNFQGLPKCHNCHMRGTDKGIFIFRQCFQTV